MRNFDWVLPASDTRQSSIIVLCVLLFRRTWRVSTGRKMEDLDAWGIRLPSCPVFLQLVLEGHKHPPCGNWGEGKCIASSVSQISVSQSPWSCFPVKSWSTISRVCSSACLLQKEKGFWAWGKPSTHLSFENLAVLEGTNWYSEKPISK